MDRESTGAPAQLNLDGTWTVLTCWFCPICTTREWLYRPQGDGFVVTCSGCKTFLGLAQGRTRELLAAPGAPELRADQED